MCYSKYILKEGKVIYENIINVWCPKSKLKYKFWLLGSLSSLFFSGFWNILLNTE